MKPVLWFNLYSNGVAGLAHHTRASADKQATRTPAGLRRVARIRVRLKGDS